MRGETLNPIDASPADLETVRCILREHTPDLEAWAFGSRVSWTARGTSDLDIVLITTEPLKVARLAEMREAFAQSRLPFRVDVIDLACVSEIFRKIIEREHAVLVRRDTMETAPTGDRQDVTLGSCATINDSAHSPEEQWSFINYLDADGITMNRISEIHHLVVGRDEIPGKARRKVLPGDIVYCMVRPNQRHFGLIKRAPENLLASTEFAVVRGKGDIVCTDFIYRYLTQDRVVEHLHRIAENGTAARPSIKASDLERLTLSIPSPREQHAITRVLGTLDDKIELNRQMSRTLEEMEHALFKSWFVDFDPLHAKMAGSWLPGESLPGLPARLYDLFPDGLVDSELGRVPEGWSVTALGDMVKVVGGSTPNMQKADCWEGGVHPWATPKDLSASVSLVLLDTETKITDAGLKMIPSGLLPPGALLLSSQDPLGRPTISEIPVAINQDLVGILPRESATGSFVFNWCKTSSGNILSRADDSNLLEAYKSRFQKIKLALPGMHVMMEFEKQITTSRQRITSHSRESQALAAQRDALLPELMLGELGSIAPLVDRSS